MTDKTNNARRPRGSTVLHAAFMLGVVVLSACDSSTTDVGLSPTPSFALVAGDQQVTWDFRSIPLVRVGPVATATGVSTSPFVSATISQNCGGLAATFGAGIGPVLLTRSFGATSCYPFISVMATGTLELKELTFFHIHNHNANYPTRNGYRTQMQINTGAGWVNIGNDVELSNATSRTQAVVNLGNQSVSGSFLLRWVATNLYNNAPNTGTEFFALYDLALTFFPLDPADANACKNGGWAQYGFRNQGQCIAFVNTGNDSR